MRAKINVTSVPELIMLLSGSRFVQEMFDSLSDLLTSFYCCLSTLYTVKLAFCERQIHSVYKVYIIKANK